MEFKRIYDEWAASPALTDEEKAELEAKEEEARSFDERKAKEIVLERKKPTMEEIRNSKECFNIHYKW